ncbi:Glycosyl hydrolases family 31 [Popillia japonica]|uniref:Glycosyl hydrolases family 31 n=1 Tax=Popillia japonica TaxID=7064 RepID=A0AAW1LSM4_POPJA
MLPATLRKNQPTEYKVRIFVGFLFLVVVFLVGLAYVLYHQKLLQRAYFEKIKFNKAKREMKIFNIAGDIVIRGNLGTTIGYDKVHPCLPSDTRQDGSICFEWMERSRLYMQLYELDSEIQCYNLQWMGLSTGVDPTDCFDMSPASGYWYGGGQLAESTFQLGKANHDFAPFVTGKIETNRWGNILKRYFINSRGAAIVIDNSTPLYVSIRNNTVNNKKELCLKAKYDDFTFVNRITPLPQLNYSICTATNMTKLHSFMAEKKLWDGLRPEESNIIHSLLTEPLWEITAATKHDFFEEAVSNYTYDVIGLGFLKQGHVLLNEFWQEHIGDFTVDEERFPKFQETIEIMHRRGFRIVFTIQPFISTESKNFAEAVKKRLLVSERFSDRRIPALTRYKSLQSAGVLDMTNNNTVPWLVDKLKTLLSTFKFDAYYLDLGVAYNMPHYYQCEKPLINPDQYKTYFINSLQNTVNIFGVNSAIERPKTPTFVSLPMFESSWNGLRKVIPTVLTYGLVGYPFLIPGAVGGDYQSTEGIGDTSFNSSFIMKLPDKDLYIRWLQLATFLPVIHFTHSPNNYGDDSLLEMAKEMTLLRQQTVTPALKKYVGVALEYGMPLVRPLWMLDANDASCHAVTDEFSIGDDIIVAPILHAGVKERDVYLPAGVWKDGIDKSLRKGSRWIHDYRVEQDQIAYFIKMPDDTRF